MIYDGAEAQLPYLSGGQIEQEASTFLKSNWSDTFPVDVEMLCDKLGIDIIQIPGLKRSFNVDSYINSDFTTIVVDEDAANNNEARYRFSIAHELGHMVLHKEYYPSDIDALDSFLRYISANRNLYAEQQADRFAAALLVPLWELNAELEKHFGKDLRLAAKEMSEQEKNLAYDEIAKHFQVSDNVLKRRVVELLK